MANKIIYLSLPVISQAIESVLAAYPDYSKQELLKLPKARQKLIIYLIKQLHDSYTVIIEDAESHLESAFSSDQELHIKNLIQQGIYYIFRESSDSNSCYINQQFNSNLDINENNNEISWDKIREQ